MGFVRGERVIDSGLAPDIQRQNEVERVLSERQLVNAGTDERRVDTAGSRERERMLPGSIRSKRPRGNSVASGQRSTRAQPAREEKKRR